MTKRRSLRGLPAYLATLPILSMSLFAQAPTGPMVVPKPVPQAATVEGVILHGLATDPVTAPYAIAVGRKNGKVVLSGRVGTKEIHDTAVRIALATTSAIDDRLVIDTATIYRSITRPPSNRGAAQAIPNMVASSYIYPPPLFGRLDDPFLGFEPPIISYPPWWGAVAARRGDPYGAPVLDPYSPIGADPGPANPNARPQFPSPVTSAEPGRSVEMTIDPRGVALLRGTVPTEEIRLGIGQKAAKLSGVKDIINQIEVDPSIGDAAQPIRAQDQPPPPPIPFQPPPAAAPIAADAMPKTLPAVDVTETPDQRLAKAIERRPALEKLGVKTEVKDGIAYLTGKVPTVLEAMLAFRAAQQTVGVRGVVDRLEFAVPDGLKPNPLIASGRPDDVEPYLEAQIRRQINDRAHIDRVRVTADRLELRGTVTKESDKAEIEAILRSMPLLRGYTIDARLIAD